MHKGMQNAGKSPSDFAFCILHYAGSATLMCAAYREGAHFVVTVIGAAVDVTIVGMRKR